MQIVSALMSDSVQPQQRNLYATKFKAMEYRDGKGNTYKEQLRQLSWPVVDDVPAHAQRSAVGAMASGMYDSLHPNANTVKSGELSFMQTHNRRTLTVEADPALSVHERLYVPSKTVRSS